MYKASEPKNAWNHTLPAPLPRTTSSGHIERCKPLKFLSLFSGLDKARTALEAVPGVKDSSEAPRRPGASPRLFLFSLVFASANGEQISAWDLGPANCRVAPDRLWEMGEDAGVKVHKAGLLFELEGHTESAELAFP